MVEGLYLKKNQTYYLFSDGHFLCVNHTTDVVNKGITLIGSDYALGDVM